MAKGKICTDQANSILNSLFKNAFLGLATSKPGDDGGSLMEPSEDAGYERHQLTSAEIDNASNSQISNKQTIFMGVASASWGTITHLFVSQSKNGKAVFYAPLGAPVSISEGQVPIFKKGEIVVAIDKDTLDATTD